MSKKAMYISIGARHYPVHIEKRGLKSFEAFCPQVAGFIAIDKTPEAAFEAFLGSKAVDEFVERVLSKMPLQERRKSCLWMEGSNDLLEAA